MRNLIIFIFLFIGPFVKAQSNDTIYVLVKVHGKELINPDWNKNQFVQKQFEGIIKKSSKKTPVHLVSDEDSTSEKHNYSTVLDISILELRIDEPLVLQQNKSLSRDVNTNNYSDEAEDLRKSHTTVYADFTLYEKSMVGFLRISMSTTHLPEVVTTWNETFAESFSWENKYGTYTGNFLALGSKEVQLSKTKPKPVPSSEQVFKELFRQALNKSSKKIADSIQ